MSKQHIILTRLKDRWYKRALIISSQEPIYFDKIQSLHKIYVTGFLGGMDNAKGCIFNVEEWPFDYKYFDLIILDEVFAIEKKSLNIILEQVNFCLIDDGDLLIANTKNCFSADIVARAITKGFISEGVYPINSSDVFIIQNLKKIISKEFVLFFKKSKHFELDSSEIYSLAQNSSKQSLFKNAKVSNNYRKKHSNES